MSSFLDKGTKLSASVLWCASFVLGDSYGRFLLSRCTRRLPRYILLVQRVKRSFAKSISYSLYRIVRLSAYKPLRHIFHFGTLLGNSIPKYLSILLSAYAFNFIPMDLMILLFFAIFRFKIDSRSYPLQFEESAGRTVWKDVSVRMKKERLLFRLPYNSLRMTSNN